MQNKQERPLSVPFGPRHQTAFPLNQHASVCVCVCVRVLEGRWACGRNRIFEHTASSREYRRRSNASGTPEDAFVFYNNIRDLITVVCFLAPFELWSGRFLPSMRIPRDQLAFSAGPPPSYPCSRSTLNCRQSRRPPLYRAVRLFLSNSPTRKVHSPTTTHCRTLGQVHRVQANIELDTRGPSTRITRNGGYASGGHRCNTGSNVDPAPGPQYDICKGEWMVC